MIEQLDGTEWKKTAEAKGKLYAMIDNLIPDTTYTYRVYGYDTLGNCGVPSEEFSFTTASDTTAPYIVSVDTSLGSYGDSMTLRMKVQDDASIDYGTFSYSYDKVNYEKITDVLVKEFVNEKSITYSWDTSDLKEGTIYVRFEVWDMAGNKDEGSNGSTLELEYTIDHTAPEAVKGFTNFDTKGVAEFTWEHNKKDDVNAYRVYRAESKDGEFVEKEVTNENGYYDTDVKVGQTYYYKVSAIDIAGNESALSDAFEVTITGDTTKPEVVGVAPEDGGIVGTNVSISTVVTDNSNLQKVVFEYCEKENGTWEEIGSRQVSGRNAHAKLEWKPEQVEEGKEYVIRVTAIDEMGNQSESKQHTISFDLEAPKATTVTVTGENSQICLNYEENKDSDFSHYEIYRMKNDGGEAYELVINTNEVEYVDSEVEPDTTYLYKVYTCDTHGNKTASKTVIGYADSVDTLEPHAVLSESFMGVANQEVQFDGLLSKDNDRIISYYWDFGDGTTSTLAKPSHSYKQEGTFVASLTVTDASGNTNSTTTNVHVNKKEASCKHKLVIKNASGAPLTGASVYVREKDIVLSTGSDGSISLVGEPGTYNLDISAPGYATTTEQIVLNSIQEESSSVLLKADGILHGSLKVEEMTYEEMQSAGIDFSDHDNFFTYKYEVTLVFATEKIPAVYTYTRKETSSKNYEVISAQRTSGDGNSGDLNYEIEVASKIDVVTDKDNPQNVAVIVPAKTIKWAKNMYKVILDIQTIADEPFSLKNIRADLSLPTGLSLAKTTTGQSHSIEVESLAAREAKSLNWYIKADEEGEYQIDCAVKAKMSPTGTNITENYSTKLVVSDLNHNGLHLYIMPEETAYYGEQYYVQYQLVNESGRTFYQVTADFGEYQNAHSVVKGENVFGGEVVDTKTVDSAVDYYVPKASSAAKIPILMEGDSITIGEFKPGEYICGTYVFTYTGGDAEHYGQLISATLEKLEGSNTDMNVTVKPIEGHMTKEQKILPHPQPKYPDEEAEDSDDPRNNERSGNGDGADEGGGDYGGNGNGGSGSGPSSPKTPKTNKDEEDPINVMRGAFHTEDRLMSMSGVRDIYFDINYDSTKTTKAGDLGYGWYHNYESYVEDKNGVINVYFNPQTSLSFIRKQAKELVVQGVYEEGRVTILEQQNQNEEYVPVSDGFTGYSLIKNDTGYLLTLSDGSTYEYDAKGTFVKTTNLYGQSISVSYNGLHTMIKDDATNKAITLTKNQNGYIETVTDVAGNQVHFSYTEGGELEIVTSKRGITTTYVYNEEHRIIKGVDHDGSTFLVNTYDNQGRVLTQDDGREDTPIVTLSYADDEITGKTTVTLKNRNGGMQTISVNAVGDGERIVNSVGGVTTYEYDANGNLISYCMPSGRSETYQYDEKGNIIQIANNLGETITYTYNDYNQLTSKVSNTGVKSNFEYNDKQQLIKAGDNGIVTTYTYDANGQITTQTVEGVGTTTYTYQDGNVTSVISPKGTVQTFVYDTIGNVVQHVDGNGICTKYEVDKNGNVTSESVGLEDESVATTTYTYDAYGNRTSVTDANGNTTRYEYNADGYCIKEVRADNSEIQYTYDVDGNLTKVVYPENIATQAALYDTAGNLLSLTDHLGSVTTKQFSPGGLLKKVTQANGGEVTFEYYDNGLLKSQKDAEGNVYRYDYDAAGRIIKLEDATGSVNQLQYDSYGNLSSMTDGEGNTISLSYNGLGQTSATTDANGNVTTYSYDALGNCIRQVDALGNETTYVYDAGNRVSQVVIKGKTSEEDHVMSYGYNHLGLITEMNDAEGNTYCMDYDKAGNLTAVYDAKNQKVLSYEYDKVYNVIRETDGNGNSISRSYDAVGNCIKEVNAKGHAVSYQYLGGQLLSASVDAMGSTSSATYDEMGNLETFTNPNGGVTTYTYDLNGNVISESVGDYYQVSYTYNEAGNVATKANSKGQITKYTYDKAGRMTSFTDELGTVSYTYDGNGNVLTVTEEKKDGTKNIITRTYDALNRVKTYADAAGNTLSYEYDCFGNLKSLTYPEGQQVTYEYNKNNMLICMTDWQGRSTRYSYDENSMLIKTERADGSVEVRSYEATGNVSSIVDKNGETVISSQYYTYDAAGNIIAISSTPLETEDSEQVGGEPDNAEQTAIATNMADSKVQLSNVSDCIMEYDTTNRLIKYNDEEVKYDTDGNMIYGPLNGEMTEFIYDCRNRLVQAGDTTYIYDAENNRIGMTKHKGSENETSLTYVVDSASGEYTQVLMSVETDKNGNSKTLYYHYGANRLVAQEETDGEYLIYHFNNVGSTTAVTNGDGTIKYQYQYSPYGELIEGNYGEVAFLYNGQYGVASDDNGLYYMRARYYNIDIRRFINQDILTGSIESSSSLNRYAYVEGNPISYLDPFGLDRVYDKDGFFQLDCGAWFKESDKTDYTGGRVKSNLALLSKNACVVVATEIYAKGLISGMGIIEMAAEIYFHTVCWYQVIYAGGWEDIWLLDSVYEFYDQTAYTDLQDGGERNAGAKAAYNLLWFSSYSFIP